MIPIPKHIQVLYVEQEIDGTETIALDAVVAADTERIALLAEQIELKEKVRRPKLVLMNSARKSY